MLIAGKMALNDIATAIVNAIHALTDESGQRVVMSTINDKQLEMAALAALQIAAGEPIWPADRKIRLPARTRMPGPFEEG